MEERLSFKQFRYFVTLVEQQSFTRAAESLFTSQPSLSSQIRKLEDIVGNRLVQRGRGPFTLTQAGEVFYREALKLLSQAERSLELARRATVGEAGMLQVGFNEIASYRSFPRHLRTFRVQYPLVRTQLSELADDEQLSRLGKGTLHVGYVHRSPIPGFSQQAGIDEAMCAVLPLNHQLTDLDSISIGDLVDEQLISLRPEMALDLWDSIHTAFEAVGSEPRMAQTVMRVTSVLGLVAAGTGIAILPESCRNTVDSQTIFRPLVDAGLSTRSYLTWNDNESALIRNYLTVSAAADEAAAVLDEMTKIPDHTPSE
jgi:DNA-binding transcriptional LysR family regulator